MEVNASHPAEQGRYLYCVVRAGEQRDFSAAPIGGVPGRVYTLRHGDLAAVVSDCPLVVFDPTRENAVAHERVNEAVMQDLTVIPMSFGTVFRTDDDVREFLRRTSDVLSDVLRKVEGKVEFGLKVTWDRERVIEELEGGSERIQRLKDEILSTTVNSNYFARMQLGRVVESALQAKADHYVSEVYRGVRDVVASLRSNKPVGDRMIMNAAFLVDRAKASVLEERISSMADNLSGRLTFLFTGPWPPYNFVRLRLRLEKPRR